MMASLPTWLAAIFLSVTLIVTVFVKKLRAPSDGRLSLLKPIEAAEKAKAGGLKLGPEPTVATSAVTPPFDFRHEPPRAYRPFKTRTHVTMGRLSNYPLTGPRADS